MPLSEPQERELLHTRDVRLQGWRRADGLYDIEAELSDRKTQGFANEDRGWIGPEDRLHGMRMRMTVDEDLVIRAFEASIDDSPYAICPGAAPGFARLAGLTIGRGFLKAAAERVGGTQGCTHLRELLQQMGTVAMQTLYGVRLRRMQAGSDLPPEGRPAPPSIDTCHGWRSDGPVVRRGWPHLYTGPDRDLPAPSAAEPGMPDAGGEASRTSPAGAPGAVRTEGATRSNAAD